VVDDVASTCYTTLKVVNFILSSDLTEAQRGQLAVEAQFYGLFRLMMPTMMPYYAQEQIGVALLHRACVVGTKHELQTAVATARALVFEMGSTTPWLTAEFQDLRYIITDRVVNGAPVWAAEGGEWEWFMYRAGDGAMWIGLEANCAAGKAYGAINNTVRSPDVLAPTQLPSDKWRSFKSATLGPQFASAPHIGTGAAWVEVPDMRVTAVHGLDDAEPTMAAALRQLAALPGDE